MYEITQRAELKAEADAEKVTSSELESEVIEESSTHNE